MYHEWMLQFLQRVVAGLFFVTGFLFLVVMMCRCWSIVQQRRKRKVEARWSHVIVQAVSGGLPDAPKIRRQDRYTILSLWNRFQDSIVGETRDRLVQCALHCGLDEVARQMLRRRRLSGRLIAIATLGHLRDASVWDTLHTMVKSPDSVLSLASAHALMRINAKRAIDMVMLSIRGRDGWLPRKVAAILQEAGADLISKPLAVALLFASDGERPRLLRYLGLGHLGLMAGVLHRIMQGTDKPDVVCACLGVMTDPLHLPVIRLFADHESGEVRKGVAAALGRIGTASDRITLVFMLHDEEWMVRHEAARALANIPFVGVDYLRVIKDWSLAPKARAAMSHVIAEYEMS